MKKNFQTFLLLIIMFFVFMINYNVKADMILVDEKHNDGLIGRVEHDTENDVYVCTVINETNPVGSVFAFRYNFRDIGDGWVVKITEPNQILRQGNYSCTENSRVDAVEVIKFYEQDYILTSINVNDFVEPSYNGNIVRSITPTDEKIDSINIKYFKNSVEQTGDKFSDGTYRAQFTIKLVDGYIFDFDGIEYPGVTKINNIVINPISTEVYDDTYIFEYEYTVEETPYTISEMESGGVVGKVIYDPTIHKYIVTITNKTHPVGTYINIDFGLSHLGGDLLDLKVNEPNQVLYKMVTSQEEKFSLLNVTGTYQLDNDHIIKNINIDNFTEPKFGQSVFNNVIPSDNRIKSVNIDWQINGGDYAANIFADEKYTAVFNVEFNDGYAIDSYFDEDYYNNDDGNYSSEYVYNIGTVKINGKSITPKNIQYDGKTKVQFEYDYNVERKITVDFDNNAAYVSNNYVTVGDRVNLSVKIDNSLNTTFDYVMFYYTKPVTKADYDIRFFYNQETDRYETSFVIDDNWQNGEYMVDRFYYSINNYLGSSIIGSKYNRNNPNALYYNRVVENNAVMSGLNFTVYGTNADDQEPVINKNSLEISDRKVVYGDTIKFRVKVTDNVGLSRVSLQLTTGSGDTYHSRTVYLEYNEVTDYFEGSTDVDVDFVEGLWKVKYVYATDTNTNTAQLVINDNSTTIYNYLNDVPSTLDSSSISLTKTNVTANDETELSFVVGNKMDIKDVKVFYKVDDSIIEYDALYDRRKTTANIGGLTETTDYYKATMQFTNNGKNGSWQIDRIEVTNSKDFVTTFYNNALHSDSSYDLSSGNFVVNGLEDDSDNPVLNSYTIDKDYVFFNDKITLKINASDELSGIKSVKVNYTLPNNSTRDYNLTLRNGDYIYEFNYDSFDKRGLYKINYIRLEDGSGNVNEIRDNITNLSFSFINRYKILTTAKFLNTTTTYRMKVIDVTTGTIYNGDSSDFEWSSSDTTIASIGAYNGALSTKSKYGATTVYLKNRNSKEILDQVEFIISNAVVNVGSITSLSNGEYVGYSEVEWEIGDQTILRPTGRYGSVSINGRYRHSIELEGLKAGTTTLTMKTPSGDILASSTVYVNNSEFTIVPDVESIDLQKGDSKKINLTVTPSSNNVIFTSQNSSVATVDHLGNVTGVSGGETNIIVYSNYSNASITIPVYVNVYTELINVESNNITLNNELENYQIQASITPEDATNKKLNFSSTNENIIKVSETGMITAIRNGNAKIRITSDDNHSSTEINVTVENLISNINNMNIESIANQIYTGSVIVPNINIYDENTKLIKDTDFEVTSNCVDVGECNITIRGIGNYKGEVQKSFNVEAANLDNVTITGIENKLFDGTKTCQVPVLTYNGKRLVEGVDYSIVCKENVYPGTARAIIRAIGPSFTGSVTKKYKIYQRKIGSATLEGLADADYTGKKTSLNLRLSYNGMILKEGIDYTVVFKDNINVGTARIIIRGMGNWSGEWKKAYRVIPRRPSINFTVLSGSGNSYTIDWIKINEADGYIVEYSDPVSIYEYNDNTIIKWNKYRANVNTTRKTFSINDPAQTIYFFRIRAYKDIDGVRYFSRYEENHT